MSRWERAAWAAYVAGTLLMVWTAGALGAAVGHRIWS